MLTSVVSRSYIERLTGENIGYMDEDVYVETLTEVICEFAKRDNIVLLGRASQFILKDSENVFHILMVADEADRVRFMQDNYSMSLDKARTTVEDGDRRRRNLYAKFAKSGYDDPTLYHMCLNMSRIPMDRAVDLVSRLVG